MVPSSSNVMSVRMSSIEVEVPMMINEGEAYCGLSTLEHLS